VEVRATDGHGSQAKTTGLERGVKYGDSTKSDGKFYYKPSQYSIREMRVLIDEDGAIESAFPISGRSVWKYAPEMNDGTGGWIHATY
jgi:hypothetical protein